MLINKNTSKDQYITAVQTLNNSKDIWIEQQLTLGIERYTVE